MSDRVAIAGTATVKSKSIEVECGSIIFCINCQPVAGFVQRSRGSGKSRPNNNTGSNRAEKSVLL